MKNLNIYFWAINTSVFLHCKIVWIPVAAPSFCHTPVTLGPVGLGTVSLIYLICLVPGDLCVWIICVAIRLLFFLIPFIQGKYHEGHGSAELKWVTSALEPVVSNNAMPSQGFELAWCLIPAHRLDLTWSVPYYSDSPGISQPTLHLQLDLYHFALRLMEPKWTWIWKKTEV